MWLSVRRVWVYSLRSQKNSSVLLSALKFPTSRAAGDEIDVADPNRFCHLPIPTSSPLCHQGHWANGSESDIGNTQRISCQIPSGGPYDAFTFTRTRERKKLPLLELNLVLVLFSSFSRFSHAVCLHLIRIHSTLAFFKDYPKVSRLLWDVEKR